MNHEISGHEFLFSHACFLGTVQIEVVRPFWFLHGNQILGGLDLFGTVCSLVEYLSCINSIIVTYVGCKLSQIACW